VGGDHVKPERGESSEFAHLVGKAAFDPAFARRLEEDPASALRHIGIEPTDEVLGALKQIDFDSIKQLAGALGDERGIV
jgi:hypothetical protein